MSERIYSIDTFRAIAMGCIVTIHAEPFGGMGALGNAVHFVIDALARFAVPFFFLTAGYLFARSLARSDPPAHYRKYVSRLASIYVFGLVIYLPLVLVEAGGLATIDGRHVPSAVLSRLLEAVSPLGLLYYGDSVLVMLWFLTALLVSISLVYLFEIRGLRRYLVPVAVGLHVIGLFGENYSMVFDVPVATRDALFFGFVYTALGFWLRSQGWTPSADRSRLYLAGFLVFSALAVVERYLLGYVIGDATFGDTVYTAEFSLVTLFVTLSLFAFVLSNPDLGVGTGVPRLGQYAVGIYVVHPAILYALVGAGQGLAAIGFAVNQTVLWHLWLTPFVFFSSYYLYRHAVRFGVVDPAGSHIPNLSRARRTAVRGDNQPSS